MKDVENLKDVPNAGVMLEDLDFILALLLKLGSELLEGLELVDELVDDLPKPLVWKLQGNRRLRAQNEVEEVAVIVVGLESLINRRSAGYSLQNREIT